LLITLVPAVALMSFWVIPREERYLEAQFFFEYLSYKVLGAPVVLGGSLAFIRG